MTINLKAPEEKSDLKPRIMVLGVGGAGGNAVNNMIKAQLEGVDFVIANTDAQALSQSVATKKLQMGTALTQGLGAGSKPEVGRAAAEESLPEIIDQMAGCHMLFITAGMGGGTGTGAAPVIAQAAKEQGILTVGVVTKPFQFEGARRMRIAEAGVHELQQYVDTLIIIPNQNLFRVANEKTTFADAFAMADEVLHSGVRGITDLMVMPGLINLDFADVRAVMGEMGKAMMGTGEAEGQARAIDAAEAAINNPLLDEVSMNGARGVLINITGGLDLTLFEVDEAANRIREEVDAEANIIVGSTFNEALSGRMRVSVVATGIEAHEGEADIPNTDAFDDDRLPGVRTGGTTWRPKDVTDGQGDTDIVAEVVATVRDSARAQGDTPIHAHPKNGEVLSLMQSADAALTDDDAADSYADGADADDRELVLDDGMRVAQESDGDETAAAQDLALEGQETRQGEKKEQNPPERPRQPEKKPERPRGLFGRAILGSEPKKRPAPARKPEKAPLRVANGQGSAASAAQSAVQSGSQSATEQLFPANEDRDQLDIPAFLRRQAN